MAHYEHIQQLSADLLEHVTGGANQNEKSAAKAFVDAAKHDKLGLAEAIAIVRKYNSPEDFAAGGMDLEEVIKLMGEQW